jgi:hypothetical protein
VKKKFWISFLDLKQLEKSFYFFYNIELWGFQYKKNEIFLIIFVLKMFHPSFLCKILLKIFFINSPFFYKIWYKYLK